MPLEEKYRKDMTTLRRFFIELIEKYTEFTTTSSNKITQHINMKWVPTDLLCLCTKDPSNSNYKICTQILINRSASCLLTNSKLSLIFVHSNCTFQHWFDKQVCKLPFHKQQTFLDFCALKLYFSALIW